MDVNVIWEGTDITTSVISYSRQHKICSGIGSLDLTVEAKTPRSFSPWDYIIIKEEGTQEGKYYITGFEKDAPEGVYIIQAQDNSKRLTDYFIKDKYEITYPSYAKYWIELFLTETGVTYSFDVTGSGAPLAENTTLGLKSAYDEITSLLQLSGWYMYFDSSGTCRISDVTPTAGGTPDYVFDDSDIIKTGYSKNDKFLRNRAVVWGAGNPQTNEWIFADTSTITSWNRDDGDYRTVVYANPHIKTIVAAFSLAWKILNEFSQITYVKELELHGTHSISLGERIRVDSNYIGYEGLVTTYTVELTSDGLKTTVTLDERCPRLFGFVHWTGYVYVGTKAHGVYRRLLKSTSWQNYSTGITDLSITDISAYDGLLGAVSSGGDFYRRHTQNASWYKYTPPPMEDISQGSGIMVVSGISAVACTIDKYSGITGSYAIAFTVPVSGGASPTGLYPTSGDLSWVVGLSAGGTQTYNHQVYVPVSGEPNDYNVTAIDIEALDTGSNVVSIRQVRDQYVSDIAEGDDGYFGYLRSGFVGNIRGFSGSDKEAYNSLPPVTSGSWLETAPWGGWSGQTITVQGNPVVNNLVTASGGYVFDWYVWGTPSGLITRYTQTKATISGGIYDYNYDYFYINHPFGTGPTDYQNYVDYFYKVDNDNYSFFNATYAYGFDQTYKKVNVQTQGVTTVTFQPTNNGQYYARWNTSSPTALSRISGGNYFCLLDISNNKSLQIYRVDMRDGTYGTVEIQAADDTVNNPPDSGDYISVTLPKESSNYLYFGVIFVKKTDIFIQNPPWDAKMRFIAVFIDKYDGTVYKNTYDIVETLTAPEGGTILSMSFDRTNEFISNDFPYALLYRGYRAEHFEIVSENPDTGQGWGGFYAPLLWKLEIDTDDDDIGDAGQWHNLTYFYNVGTPNGSWVEVERHDNILSQSGSSWLSETSPAWMHAPSGVSYIGFGSAIDENSTGRDIFSTESRYSTQVPFLWTHYTTTKYGDFTEAIVDTLDWASYSNVELINRDTNYIDKLTPCKPKTDEVEDIIYASIGSRHPTSNSFYYYIVAYDSAGNIVKKLQPDGRAADDYNGYWFFRSIPATYEAPEFTIVFDMVLRHDFDVRGFGVTADQRWDFDYFLPYVSGLWKRTDVCKILRHDPVTPSGQFTLIYTHSDPLYVDAAKGTPTIIYEYPASGAVISGGTQYGGNSHLIGASFLNELGSFTTEQPLMPVFSARVFDVTESGNFPPMEEGQVDSLLDRYVGLAGGFEGIRVAGVDVQLPYATLKTFPGSGEVTQVDFTNFEEDPYIVASVRGSTTSGVFFQRSPGSSTFVNVTSGLPPSEIMIVRIDDKV